MEREKVGKISLDLAAKAHENSHSPEEQMKEQLTGFENELSLSIANGKSKYSKDFFVVVITKKERLMPNVLRNYFFNRLSCPTPDYDQIVFYWNHSQNVLDFLWVLPAKDICDEMMLNRTNIHPDEYAAYSFIHSFYDGTLMKYAHTLNGDLKN